jgi:hypothetical protein
LAEQGVENPYDKFSGWLRHFMRARSKLTEIGEITYYNQSTEEVAQRGLRESSQGSMKMKGRMAPSLGLWEPRSSEAVFVVCPVS